ncbi:type II toxin-antitoxin system PemK/MazF family toxin [Sulfurovum riftiae]|uniref:mRNA interferase n=1 Tax=Sulfurovum riftiae TaxID=1630136 RepID=A0A151CDP4_9BACT|nr:type II toxin-antitoxin system PemK/MazF family toxin [Sulfurovum riftiae]KYJ85579.1 PemK family transcriptional regulator [Sulfurovum riftiae]
MFDRGSIYLAKLYPSKGAEPGKTRPVMVLQTNMLNHIGHTTVIVVPLTTKLVEGAYPLRYRIEGRENLLQNSELLCDQIRAIDVKRLIPEKLATLSLREMAEVEQQIQAILEFE